MPLYLGLDCGGSSCRAMAIDETGEPVFLAQGGSANLVSTEEAAIERSLHRALDQAPPVEVVCACFAGMLGEEQQAVARQRLAPFIGAAHLVVEPDFAAALRACPEGTTICIVAGTGSVICSRPNGVLTKSGGGGYLLGDEGSGFRYGQAALKQFLADPTQASEQLKGSVCSLWETLDPAEITVKVYRTGRPAAAFAKLSTAFARDVQEGKPYALQFLESESRVLAQLAVNHFAKHYLAAGDAPAFALAGGLWKRAIYREAFATAMAEIMPGATVERATTPPVRGAALLALEAGMGGSRFVATVASTERCPQAIESEP